MGEGLLESLDARTVYNGADFSALTKVRVRARIRVRVRVRVRVGVRVGVRVRFRVGDRLITRST